MTSNTSSRPLALITGASSGIGAAFAERLAHDQYDLIIVARRRERLEALAQRLGESYKVSVEVLAVDLSKADDLMEVEKRLADDSALELLINNAGFGGYKPFITLEPDLAEEQIRLHVIALTRLTRAVLPGMITRGHGGIINVSSRLAFSGSITEARLPKRATYAATKAYINTFTQILHHELEGTGVKVQALCPGVVKTEFHQILGVDPNRFPAEIVSLAENVVEASLNGLRNDEVICVPGLADTNLLNRIDESQRAMFDNSGGGSIAQRYAK